ncbi:transcriptional regulator [Frigidibacter mobilis]|uniref:Transcriptional regulator n=2 Tax=Paracoccaceae TaxID=31989 RepID=A0A159Z3U4_9RHOB|nr:transcriptional regulator [Frigidibacter mobilis]
MLTERLRMLQAAGVIWREQAETIPPAATYGLTPRGNDLHSVLEALGSIAERWKVEGSLKTMPSALVDCSTRQEKLEC